MKKLILAIILFLSLGLLHAQEYETSVGIRTGMSNGITVKHFVSRYNAFEGILTTRYGGFIVSGLYEFQNQLKVANLSWYYGIGGHIGYFSGNRTTYPDWWETNKTDAYTILGADAIIGLEYVFSEAPISFSLDWKPGFNLMGYSGIWADNFALSIRYILK